MREIVKMIVVLALITGASGLLLAGVNEGTREQRKMQLLEYVKGPAVLDVLQGSSNAPLADVQELQVTEAGAEQTVDIFPAFKDGELWGVAFERSAGGYGGDIGVIVGIEVRSGALLGIGVTTHKETPGLGARIVEPGFRAGFEGKEIDQEMAVAADGGSVDAISGATISSRGVCAAVNKAIDFYKAHKEEILSTARRAGS